MLVTRRASLVVDSLWRPVVGAQALDVLRVLFQVAVRLSRVQPKRAHRLQDHQPVEDFNQDDGGCEPAEEAVLHSLEKGGAGRAEGTGTDSTALPCARLRGSSGVRHAYLRCAGPVSDSGH